MSEPITNLATSGANNIGSSGDANLADLVFAVMAQRANLIEENVKDQITAMKKMNANMEKLNDYIAKINAADDGDVNLTEEEVTLLDDLGITADDFKEFGTIKDDTWTVSSDKREAFVTYLKSKSSSMETTSQMDMATLQSTMGKYNNTYDALSNFINKYGQSTSTIINNIRS